MNKKSNKKNRIKNKYKNNKPTSFLFLKCAKLYKHPQKNDISWIEKLKMRFWGIEKKRKFFLFF